MLQKKKKIIIIIKKLITIKKIKEIEIKRIVLVV